MIERRVRDLRLDSRLRSTCENEIFNMCAYQGVSVVDADKGFSMCASKEISGLRLLQTESLSKAWGT